jgi:hypothetical protein
MDISPEEERFKPAIFLLWSSLAGSLAGLAFVNPRLTALALRNDAWDGMVKIALPFMLFALTAHIWYYFTITKVPDPYLVCRATSDSEI